MNKQSTSFQTAVSKDGNSSIKKQQYQKTITVASKNGNGNIVAAFNLYRAISPN
ncbi:MAG: hypothetical protein LBB93_00820 [Elusimicrobiota bacterium]|jgi:hypothetical protein|nr:hypothetical protein [Elusimicrobiota bacterium]